MSPVPPFVRNDNEYLAMTVERPRTVPFRLPGRVLQTPAITQPSIVRTERGPGTWVERNRITGEVVARSD